MPQGDISSGSALFAIKDRKYLLGLTPMGNYSKTCLNWPLSKRSKIGFQNQLSFNAGQKYCRILLTFIKLPFVIKIFVLSMSGCLGQVLLYMFILSTCIGKSTRIKKG